MQILPVSLSPEDERYFEMAYKEAILAFEEGEIPVGAVISCKGELIAKAHNAVERLNDPTAHAEMLTLSSSTYGLNSKYLKDCTLYVTLEPCPMCASALRWSQIGRIIYGASDVKNGFSAFSERLIHPKTQLINGYRAEECATLMQNFFKIRRKSLTNNQI